jgi:hypothetical protein
MKGWPSARHYCSPVLPSTPGRYSGVWTEFLGAARAGPGQGSRLFSGSWSPTCKSARACSARTRHSSRRASSSTPAAPGRARRSTSMATRSTSPPTAGAAGRSQPCRVASRRAALLEATQAAWVAPAQCCTLPLAQSHLRGPTCALPLAHSSLDTPACGAARPRSHAPSRIALAQRCATTRVMPAVVRGMTGSAGFSCRRATRSTRGSRRSSGSTQTTRGRNRRCRGCCSVCRTPATCYT